MTEIAALGKAFRASAESAGSFVLEAIVPAEANCSLPQVGIDLSDLGRLVESARPKAVYYMEQVFDVEAELEDAQEALADFGVEALPAELKAARRSLAPHNGEICIVVASAVVDGILHTAIGSADWYGEFNETVDEVTSRAQEDAEAGRLARKTAASTAVREKATILAAHPSFNFSRVSFEKRLMLAEALFNGCEHSVLSEVTRLAENLFWLEQSGFKRDF